MGSGRWDTGTYSSGVQHRTMTAHSMGVPVASVTFAHNLVAQETQQVHPTLDPRRIQNKPYHALESRDSEEHPESNAVLMCFDVTGSNYNNAVAAQTKLPNLMDLLLKYLSDPQVAVAANDDWNFVGANCLQISDFESDNRIDEHIRNVWLVGKGGGNMGESYDLLLYLAARKTILDCELKRSRKGYFFLYADEPFFTSARAEQIRDVFGDPAQADIPVTTLIEQMRQHYYTYILWPTTGYIEARDQFVSLFGDDSVITLQAPELICETVGSIVGLNEERVSPEHLEEDLVGVGVGADDLTKIAASVTKVRRKIIS